MSGDRAERGRRRTNDRMTLDELIELYDRYGAMGFPQAAVDVLSMVVGRPATSTKERWRTAALLDEAMFQTREEGEALRLLDKVRRLVCEERPVPCVMFHLYGWLY